MLVDGPRSLRRYSFAVRSGARTAVMSGRRSCDGSIALRAPSPASRSGLPGAAGELALDRLTGEVRPCAGARHPREPSVGYRRRVGSDSHRSVSASPWLPRSKGSCQRALSGSRTAAMRWTAAGPWIVDDQILEGHDAQLTPNHVE